MTEIAWERCSDCGAELQFCRCGAVVRCHECGEPIEYENRCVLVAHGCPYVFCRDCQQQLYWELPMHPDGNPPWDAPVPRDGGRQP